MTSSFSQPILKSNGFFLLLLILGMTGPLSIDMYLAAFPIILEDLKTTPEMLSFTLSGFTLFMAVGMLLNGTISDKFGRKPILLGCITLYFLGSLGCVFTPNIEFFIVARMIQAFGAGGMIAVPMAIVKDSFADHERTKVIATLQMFTVLGPTLAPIIGAQLIKYFPWEASFVVLSLISAISFAMASCLRETHRKNKRLQGNTFQSILSLGLVLKHKGFMSFLCSTAMNSVTFMAYLAVSSYIYIKQFGLSETTFSIYFAINATLLIFAPKFYLIIKPHLRPSVILRGMLVFIFISCVLTATIGSWSPTIFLICFAPVALSNSFARSFATDILLSQPKMNAGASASVISFTNVAFGAVGMMISSSFTHYNLVVVLGTIGIIMSVLSFLFVSYFTYKKLNLVGYQ